jgi:hypothetical protein
MHTYTPKIEVFTFLDKVEAFEHLLIYSLKRCFSFNNKSYGKGVDPPPRYGELQKGNFFFILLKPSRRGHILFHRVTKKSVIINSIEPCRHQQRAHERGRPTLGGFTLVAQWKCNAYCPYHKRQFQVYILQLLA